MHALHLAHQLGAIERDVEEELQARDGGVDGDRRGATIDHVQLEAPQILSAGGVRSALEEGGQAVDGANVGGLGRATERAHAHVVEHALA